MRGYPNVGSLVLIKETQEAHRVKALWKPGRVLLEDGSIFYLRGLQRIYTIYDVLQAECNLGPLICLFCGSLEVTYHDVCTDAYCASCGRWQLEGPTLFDAEQDAAQFALKKCPSNVRPVYVEDIGKWALLVNCSRTSLPTLGGNDDNMVRISPEILA